MSVFLTEISKLCSKSRQNYRAYILTWLRWDLRSTRQGTKDEGSGIVGEAMYIIERNSQNSAKKPVGGEGVKVFSVVWDKEVGIVSGGEDKVIQINRGQGITAATV